MSAEIINGKEIALKIREDLKEKVAALAKAPKLAVILVGHDGPSEIYVRNKQKAAAEIGIETELFHLKEDVREKELIELIDRLNNDKSVNGILLQLPVPAHIDGSSLLERINPIKDVDGFHPYNIGLLQNGAKKGTIAATPKGVLKLIKSVKKDLEGLNALVIGRSVIVGKPMAMLLLNENCTVSIAHSHTKNLEELCQKADIVVSATGCGKMVKAGWVKKGAIVIDVGICRDENGKLCGDVDFESVKEVASYITPVPGGVGPMTIAMLLENTLEAYLKQNA
ncbi:MAG TPA: bifunctional methylenetetrahydrofolate dehydrogenase/methenyltetrahydrofolate cyclohydrolase FolD [Alphaproteobacteria bacterium]|nr:bifunctional methylenetetrahydrofolate dehydrogenase/methenyltetrahydrofolate cyclohydrolase FolD [Alphaproteobacteria bacterium]